MQPVFSQIRLRGLGRADRKQNHHWMIGFRFSWKMVLGARRARTSDIGNVGTVGSFHGHPSNVIKRHFPKRDKY